MGHEAGDQYIKDSCKLICEVYKHSPVYRIGGDEFVVFLTGSDYKDRDSLYSSFNELDEKNMSSGGPVVSAGMCILDEEHTGFDAVFEHADLLMYERKKELKSRA